MVVFSSGLLLWQRDVSNTRGQNYIIHIGIMILLRPVVGDYTCLIKLVVVKSRLKNQTS